MRFLASQQDYGWFIVSIVWASALILWTRQARRERGWDWVVWSGLASIATAAIETCTQVSGLWPDQRFGIHPVADTVLGSVAALHVAGWCGVAFSRSSSGWRVALVGAGMVALAYGAAKWWFPERWLWLLPLCVAIPGSRLFWQWRNSPHAAGAILASAATVLLGSWGPISNALHVGRRWTELNPFGVVSLAAHAGAGAWVCLALWRQTKEPATEERADRVELNWFLALLAIWLGAGFALAIWSTRIAHATFAESLRAQAAIAGRSIDTAALQTLLGPAFKVDKVVSAVQPTGLRIDYGVSHALARADRSRIERQLDVIKAAVPKLRSLFIVTLRDGQVLGCIFPSSNFAPGGDLSIERRTTADDELAWRERSERFWGLVSTPYGDAIALWEPLALGDEMLGWLALEYSANEWLSHQAQARWQMFAITGLGVLAGVFAYLQRRHEREANRTRQHAQLTAAISVQKSAFLAKVSHELRTPIQTILGYAEWLERSSERAENRERAAALHQHTTLMLRLVNDLLDLGAIEAGSFRLAARPFAPAELVRHAFATFAPAADAKHLRLEVDIDPDAPAAVRGDSDRFSQIALNLVSNAVKFTLVGGVRVALRSTPDPGGELLRLEVSDTGPGIPDRQLRTLFEPFTRLERTSPQQGAGLGLCLAAALCRSMGGQLQVQSEEGRGSVFTATVRLPREESHRPAAVETFDLGGYTILVAEDNALIRELFSSFLTDCGAHCVAAADGIAALLEAERHAFDVVFVDLSMPRLDGIGVTRALRQYPPRSRPVRIIGVSAHATAAERDAALAAGMDDFLAKPTPLADLARAAQGDRARPSSPAPVAALPPIVERLREQFRLEIDAQTAALAAAVAAETWSEVRVQAHYLANSAVAIQDPELQAVCGALERAAAAGDAAGVRTLAARLDDALAPWRSPAPFPS